MITAGTVLEDTPYPLPVFAADWSHEHEPVSASGQRRDSTPKAVICRLEEAGATLLALPGSGWSTRLRTSSLEIVRAAVESYGWTTRRIRPPIPSAARITRMDEALGWIR